MGALRFDGVNDVVSISSGMTGNVGSTAYTARFKGIVNALPASGLTAFIGTSQTTQSNGFILTAAGAFRVYSAGTNRYGSADGLISAGVAFDYTLDHQSGGAWTITNNLTSSVVASGTFSTSTTWAAGSNSLNQFGRSSSSNANFLSADMEIIAVTGLANSEEWNANLSGGTGSTLPTTSGNNQGSLVNFPTDNSQWIGFGGATVASSIGYDVGEITFAASSTVSTPLAQSAISFDIGEIVYAVTASSAVPVSAAIVGYDIGGIEYSVNATALSPGVSASVSYDIGQIDFDVAMSVSAPVFSADIAYDIGEMVYSVDASAIPAPIASDVSFDIGAIEYSVTANVLSAGNAAIVAYDIGEIFYAVSASSSVPVFESAVSYDIGSIDFAVTANSFAPGSLAAISYDIGAIEFSVNSSVSPPVPGDVPAAISYDIGAISYSAVILVSGAVSLYGVGDGIIFIEPSSGVQFIEPPSGIQF